MTSYRYQSYIQVCLFRFQSRYIYIYIHFSVKATTEHPPNFFFIILVLKQNSPSHINSARKVLKFLTLNTSNGRGSKEDRIYSKTGEKKNGTLQLMQETEGDAAPFRRKENQSQRRLSPNQQYPFQRLNMVER